MHHMRAVTVEARRGHLPELSWSYRELRATMWVLGTTDAFNH